MKLFIFILILLFSSEVMASSQTAIIKHIIVRHSDGLQYIYLHGTRDNKPSCARGEYWMIGDENSVAGKTQMSIILLAYASNKKVKITGTGNCSRWRDGETIDMIQLYD